MEVLTVAVKADKLLLCRCDLAVHLPRVFPSDIMPWLDRADGGNYADVAQSVEQSFCKRQVMGSSPIVGSWYCDQQYSTE